MQRMLVFVLLCAPRLAHADTLYVGGSGPGANYEPGVFIQGQDVYAGSYNGVYSTTTGTPYVNVQIYCVDVKDDISFDTSYTATESALNQFSVLQGAIPDAATNIAAVMGAAWGGFAGFVSTDTNWNAALQVALWNAEYAGKTLDPSFITGTPNATVLAEAQHILNIAFNSPAATAYFASLGFANTELFTAANHPTGYGQDMVTWNPGSPGDPPPFVIGAILPEPASATLLGMGAFGFFGFTALKRRKRAAA